MYVRQVLGSVVVGVLAFAAATRIGMGTVSAVGVLVVGAIGTRWVWATIGRTRYWLQRGTQNIYYEHCPNCRSRRYRVTGDWLLQCHKCGWKTGRPIFRWFTSSVPAIQFRRSVTPLPAFIVGLVLGLMFSRPSFESQPEISAPTFSVPAMPPVRELLIGVFVAIGVIILIFMIPNRRVYCANCGQDLGREDVPDRCPKCGSNRFTHVDPGVGEKVRVEHVEKDDDGSGLF